MPSKQFAEWRQLLENCRRKATRKSVHALRVVTLRMQVEMQRELDDLPRVSHEAQAMLRFGKLGRRLRNALAPVRELDVWIGKLRSLRESLSKTTGYVPRSTQQTIDQIERLEDRLAKRRKRAALKLVRKMETRWQDLLFVSRELDESGARIHEADGKESAMLLERVAAIAAEFPVLNVSNLHEFRKRLKQIRYLAEFHRGDPACQRIATQLKKAQTAIGDWHDWEALANVTRRKKRVKDVELADMLDSIGSEACQSAIEVSQGMLKRMAELESQDRAALHPLRKATVRSENVLPESAKKLA